MTEEHKKKIGDANRGRKFSDEHKRKLSLSNVGKKRSDDTKRKMSTIQTGKESHFKGKKHSESSKEKIRIARLGVKYSDEYKKRQSESHKGEKHYNWQGGKTSDALRIRRSMEYRLWRTAVYERDDYTCIWCFQRGGRLEADHIKPFAHYPELRFAIDNGRTLCKECHKKTDTYGNKKLKPGVQS